MPHLTADDYTTVEARAELKRRAMAETLEYLDRLSEPELNRDLPRVSKGWGAAAQPRLCLAGVAMCRLLGHPAPDTDDQR
jgi:hypothetical protein